MFAFSIWALNLQLFGANLLIVLPICVIAEYSRFRGANSLHNCHWIADYLRLVLEVDFAPQSQCNFLRPIKSFSSALH